MIGYSQYPFMETRNEHIIPTLQIRKVRVLEICDLH